MFYLIYLLFVIQAIVDKVHASQSHSTVHQYVHVTGPKGYQALPYPALINPSYKEPEIKHVIPGNPVAYPGLPHPMPVTEEAKPPELPKKNDKEVTNTFDTNLLNNLAIALQLLIVSNILNMPQEGMQDLPNLTANLPLMLSNKPDLPVIVAHKQDLPVIMAHKQDLPVTVAHKQDLPVMIAPKQDIQQPFTIIYKPYDQAPIILSSFEGSPYTISYENAPMYSEQLPQTYYIKDPLPNANFLTSGFVEPNILAPIGATQSTRTRKSVTLMSPYEALGTCLDSVGATKKRDLPSPYSSILSDKDLFSISDLF